jgi:hypothetical protein
MVQGDNSCRPVVNDRAERLLSALASGADGAATGAPTTFADVAAFGVATSC